jgi:hypothetical protein
VGWNKRGFAIVKEDTATHTCIGPVMYASTVILELLHEPGCIIVSGIHCYVIIRKLLDSVFDMPVFICWWEIETYWVNTYLTRWQWVCVNDVRALCNLYVQYFYIILADPANVVLPYKLFLGNFLV